jgi:DNA-binding transcriptional regulator YiaG
MKKKIKKTIGQQIIESLQHFVETLESGADIEKTFRCHHVEVDAKPVIEPSKVVLATRKMVGASQTTFAKFMGVPVQTVRSWERGDEVPNDMAKRFMDEIRLKPDYWRTRLREMTVPKKRARAS